MRSAAPTTRLRFAAASLVAVLLAAGSPVTGAPETGHAARAQQTTAADASGDTLTLEKAVRIGLDEDPDIRVERADREAASGRRLADYGAFLPRLTAGARFGRNDFTTVTFRAPEGSSRRLQDPESGISKSSTQNLSLDWTLLEGGRRFADWKAGGARMDAAGHRVSWAERQTTADVRVAYLAALQQRALVDVAERQLEARRRDLRLARERYAIADADRSEILGARSDTLDARMRLLEARRRARSRARELRTAMGVEESRLSAARPLAPIEELPELDSVDVESLVRRAVRGHPEIAALEAEARAASADLWAARATYLPTVSLGYSLGRSERLGREGSFFVLDPSNESQSFSLQVSWNLFDGFQREQQRTRASTTLRRTRAQRTKRRMEVTATVRNRVEELRRRRERLTLIRRKLEVARERVEVMRERFRLGDVSYLELQRVIEQLDAAERERIDERYAYLTAWAELERVTGPIAGEDAPSGAP